MNNKIYAKVISVIITYFLLFTPQSFSQGVAINTTGATVDSSAAFEVTSTTGGILIPRMTTAERNAIDNPKEGLQIINLTTHCLEIYFPPLWQSVFCGCNLPLAPTSATHNTAQTEITWNWNAASGATGYKFNTVNDYGTATDNGTNTSYTQTGLTCNTSYTLYVWAYNSCGNSMNLVLNQTTSYCCPTSFTDSRDGQTYEAIKIGYQCWMKKNLNYNQNSYGNDWCYDNNSSNCSIYGRLYDWAAAMAGSSSSSSNPSGVQGVCPTGWHLPSDDEWKQLEIYLGMTQSEADATSWRGTDEGGKMKEAGATHWSSPNTGATNSSNFSALPGGIHRPDGTIDYLSYNSEFWSATTDGTNAWSRKLVYNYSTVDRGARDKGLAYSVRCLRNN